MNQFEPPKKTGLMFSLLLKYFLAEKNHCTSTFSLPSP